MEDFTFSYERFITLPSIFIVPIVIEKELAVKMCILITTRL